MEVHHNRLTLYMPDKQIIKYVLDTIRVVSAGWDRCVMDRMVRG